jgi:hypothetical protein
MKRVKGVEDLNICIIGAQGIVGVGAKTTPRKVDLRYYHTITRDHLPQ